jgi:serine/threonine protein kinase
VELSSHIEGVSVTESPTDDRFGTTLRARATVEGADRGIALRVFDHGSAGRQFERALTDRLDAWQAVGDRSGVATVHGFGTRPRPWIATGYIDGTLATVEMPSVGHVRALAESVATIHERGVVHGGLDPRTIRLPGGELDGSSTPKIDWVGLLAVFRAYGVTGSYLDPRFAAPEHFEPARGGIDQATDIYGLGAIVYWLATGRPPFDGSTDEIQRAVLTSSPIPPSDVKPGLPEGIDDVIERAMATEKITRYESARQLLADLRRFA